MDRLVTFDFKNKVFSIIENSRKNIIKNINNEMLKAYWEIGQEIIEEEQKGKQKAEYGKKIMCELSKELTLKYGKGFSKSNLFNMRKFYLTFPIFQTVSGKFTWSHFLEFMKIEEELEREFYMTLSSNEGWSVRILKDRINSMLYQRTAISKKPEETIKNDLLKLQLENKMEPNLFIKDPYILDFLELSDTYSEKDLENAILIELEKFILEFGSDFAFLARQKRIKVGQNDYYLDLLFYHRKMRRLVLIELKIGKFQPQDKGQVELYLKWLSKYEKQEFEEEPIAIILCANKDEEEVTLLDLEKDNIHISEYWLELPPKEILEKKLSIAIKKINLNCKVKLH